MPDTVGDATQCERTGARMRWVTLAMGLVAMGTVIDLVATSPRGDGLLVAVGAVALGGLVAVGLGWVAYRRRAKRS